MKLACTTALLTAALVAPLHGDDRLPLDKMLETPISTAAKYDQKLSSVAASVTVITAEEIERYGWTSLDQALDATRGFFITYDRIYTYAGLRGIGRPTDFNTRILILVDGQSVYNQLVGGSAVGNDLAIDMSMVERIEIIRGPGSALYGSHAMLAVINVITKSADAVGGVSVTAIAGSDEKRGASLRLGQQFANGLQLTASANWQETAGASLFFPEYDSPETNHGVAVDRDYENFHRFALALRKGGFRLNLTSRSQTKGIPTAMWETVFNADEAMTHAQDVATIDYHRNLGRNWSFDTRAYWDRSRYRGHFQYDDLGVDRFLTRTAGGEARLQWDLSMRTRITAGVEYARVRPLDYSYRVGDYEIDLQQPTDMTSYYVQYEGHPSQKWEFVAGVRRDDYFATADATNPRAAVLYTPNSSRTLKLLYGQAFRSPNIYESYYSDPVIPWKAHPDLQSESIRTTELVWEERLSPTAMLLASAFHISASDLIDQQLEPASQIYWYDNVGEVKSDGADLGLQIRRKDGLWYRFSGSLQHTHSNDQPADNSPRLLLKAGVSTSPWAPWHGGLEANYETSRRTRDGDTTPGFLLVNGIASRQLNQHFRLALSARNLLGTGYSNPVGPELRQQSIRQDGRTFTLRLTYTR